ncbi:MAG: DUF4838 domain-containing protein, partial [Chloroflexi bacterium]|nr:DUF4838 domain-containing protein [Chloroflexota bacterium]
WYTSKVSRIPKRTRLAIPPLNQEEKPALKYREVLYRDLTDSEFAARLRLNGNTHLKPEERPWGAWCHSFYTFVPPERHFADHPEYFSLVDGKRIHEYQSGNVKLPAQLCLSNPKLMDVVEQEMRRKMGAKPQAQFWSFSQMDGLSYCQCDSCRAIHEREGSPMGSLMDCLNRLAARFPDKTLSTLAYTYTQRPPRHLRPATNVCVMLVASGVTYDRPIAASPDTGRGWPDGNNAVFRGYLEQWSACGARLFVWDYIINFVNLLAPYPNLRVLQPNLRLFVSNGAEGVFAQGNREVGGEFCELRAYLMAKLLWNPEADVDAIMDDFLAGYYGAAGVPIRRYIDLMSDAVARSEDCLVPTDSPQRHANSFLATSLVAPYQRLFDEAEQLVADNPPLLERVQTARMPALYAQLELRYGDVATRRQLAEKLFRYAQRAGIEMFSEVEVTTQKYQQKVFAALAKESEKPAAARAVPGARGQDVAVPAGVRTVRLNQSPPRLVAWIPEPEPLEAAWWFPQIHRWPTGEWAVTTGDRFGESSSVRRVFVSEDGGVSWQAGVTGALPFDTIPPACARFPDGEAFFVAPPPPTLFGGFERVLKPVGTVPMYGNVKLYEPGGPSSLRELAIWRYRPADRRWSEETARLEWPQLLLLRRGDWLDRPWIESRPIVAGGERILVADIRLPARLADGSVPVYPPVVLLSSADRGRTWVFGGIIAHDRQRMFVRARLAPMPSGGLICLLGTSKDDKPRPIYLTRTNKSQEGWSQPELWTAEGAWPEILGLDCGVTVVAYGAAGKVWLRLSADPEGRVWTGPLAADEETTGDFREGGTVAWAPAYASLAALDARRFLMAYRGLHQASPRDRPRQALLAREVTVD